VTPESDGLSVSHIYIPAAGPPAFADPTSATSTTLTDGFTILVWAGLTTGAPTTTAYITTSFEFLPVMGSEWLFSTQAWVGSRDVYSDACQSAVEMWSAMGCTGKEKRDFFHRVFGVMAPKSAMDVGSEPTVGIAYEAPQIRALLRQIVAFLPKAKAAEERKELDHEVVAALVHLSQIDLRDPAPPEKLALTRDELRQMVKEFYWLEESQEEKDSPTSTVSKETTRSRSAGPPAIRDLMSFVRK